MVGFFTLKARTCPLDCLFKAEETLAFAFYCVEIFSRRAKSKKYIIYTSPTIPTTGFFQRRKYIDITQLLSIDIYNK